MVLGVGGPAGPTVVFGVFVVFDEITSKHAARASSPMRRQERFALSRE
jgi:hypothetical protein